MRGGGAPGAWPAQGPAMPRPPATGQRREAAECEEAGSRVPRPLRARPPANGQRREAAECVRRRGPGCPAHSGPGHAPATRRAQRAGGGEGGKLWLSDPLGASTGAFPLPLQRAPDTGQCPVPTPGLEHPGAFGGLRK